MDGGSSMSLRPRHAGLRRTSPPKVIELGIAVCGVGEDGVGGAGDSLTSHCDGNTCSILITLCEGERELQH